jgi:hypothetical protein
MTIVFETHSHRNASNDATIYIERYTDKYVWGWSEPRWKVVLHKDGQQLASVIKENLKCRPSKKRIQQYIEEL